ncbi:MAG: nucleocapsid [Tomato betanucleorhabdovirus 1]|uniref:Nucleoprotein n=1 Tax=Tomato betanucleorhabdovirus 1 TaxID=2950850 RepID=A0AAE9SGU0_9RHAB|nr:MAG: nucleocapsid [Tomato betanucleorhabdovirus 1]
MASISLNDLKAIRDDYSALPKDSRPELSSGQCSHKEYNFDVAVRSSIYQVHYMKDEEIMSSFHKIVSADFKAMSEQDLYELVSIAINIRHPTNVVDKVDDPWPKTQLCPDFATAKPSIASKVSMIGEDKPVMTTIIPTTTGAGPQATTAETQASQAKAACFLFGWLTRFAVKSPSASLMIQYSKMKETFMKFYKESSQVFDKFTPDPTWLICLRNAFDAFVKVKNTLVVYIASAENASKADPQVFNIMRYLFFQNLEFMGMHAYVSIVTIMNKVALPPGLVLTWLRMSGCELAVDEAFTIMSKHDNGMITGGDTAERLWKYARLLDAGYFNRLQTSYAAGLVATLAYIEIYLGISQETGYASPLNIFAIANNKHIKDIGKAKAQAFMECKNSMISLSSDASVVDKIYASRTGKIHAEQQDTMEIDPDINKRPAAPTPEEPTKKRKTPSLNLPPPPEM